MTPTEAAIVLELAQSKGALRYGKFQLSSGAISSYYFDGRLVTLDPEGAYHIARAILPILRECGAEAIAGPTVGADPIVACVAVMSQLEGRPVPGLIVRKSPKGHGQKRMIEGPLTEGAKVAVVDDTCTSGSNLFHAIRALESQRCKVVKVIAILDRREGGSDDLKIAGYDFEALLECNEQSEIVVSTPR